jgi:hypothetical protein
VDRYYYIASTLPTPQFAEAPPMSSAEFRGICARSLAPADRPKIEAVGSELGGAEALRATGLLGRYFARETLLRNELARLRGQRGGNDPSAFMREGPKSVLDPEAIRAAARAFGANDPLASELDLERSRWNWLEQESGRHVFDIDALVAYLLKILVLERLQLFREEHGAREYDAVYAAVLARANGVPA